MTAWGPAGHTRHSEAQGRGSSRPLSSRPPSVHLDPNHLDEVEQNRHQHSSKRNWRHREHGLGMESKAREGSDSLEPQTLATER